MQHQRPLGREEHCRWNNRSAVSVTAVRMMTQQSEIHEHCCHTRRRYRHFEALHRRLRDCPALRGLTDGLPPKRLLTARDAPFVMRRRDELDRYLQALLAHAELARHPELQQFLGAEGRTRAACTEVGSSTPLSTPRPAVPAAGKETCMSPESTATGECSTHSNICSGADGENALCATSNSSGDGCTAQGATACSGSSCSSDSNLMLASRTRSAPATSSRLQHSVGTADTAVPPTGCASSVLVRTRRDAGAASEVGCKEGAAVATTSGIETAQPELSAAARRTQHLQSPTGSELKQHQMQHQQQQQQRQEDELEHCGPSLPSAGASCALAKRTARQPSNRSVRARQQVLTGNQLPASTRRLQENDSGDASCSLPRQSPAVPTQPSSPPVPNRMLPQPSLLLEDTAALAGPTEGGHSLAITPTHSDTPAAAATTGTMPCKQRLLLPTAALVSAAEVLQQQQQLDAASEQPGQPAQQQETQLHHPRPSVKPSPLGDADESAPKAHAITAASPASPGSAVRTPARRRSRSRSLRHGSALSALGDASLRSVSPASAGAALPPCESPAILRVAPPPTPGGAEDWAGALPPWGALDADGADADYEDDGPDNSGLIRPLYELVSCVFELRSAGFVRRPVISLVRQLLSLLAGGAIDDLLQRTLSGVLSDQSVAAQLVRLQGQLWPGGVWFARAAAPPGGTPARPPPVSAERYLDWPPPPDAPDVAAALREALHAAAVPAPLLALLGKGAYARALDDVHSMLQSRTLMQHCGFLMLEAALSALFPEIRSTLKAIHTTGPP
jgi:PX domain/Sorting nexin C terminal